MKKIVNSLFLVALIIIMSACKSEDEVLKIGFIGTLSGPYSEVGVKEMYGTQMAVEEINSSGGINGFQIELIIRDDEGDPEKAVEMQNELKELGCDIIIGHSLSIVAEEAVHNANEKDILLFSPSIGTDELSGLKDNLFRNVSTIFTETQYISESIIEANASSVLLIYNLDNYVLTKYYKLSAENIYDSHDDVDFVSIGYHTNNQEEITEVENLLQSGNFDAIMIASPNTDAATFINYMNSHEINGLEIHLSSWASTGIISYIDNSNTGDVYTYSEYNDDLFDSDFRTYQDSYSEIYGMDADMLSSNAYDLVYLLKDLLNDLEEWDNDSIRNALSDGYFVDGINGEYTINEYGDCVKNLYRYKIVNDELILID